MICSLVIPPFTHLSVNTTVSFNRIDFVCNFMLLARCLHSKDRKMDEDIAVLCILLIKHMQAVSQSLLVNHILACMLVLRLEVSFTENNFKQ